MRRRSPLNLIDSSLKHLVFLTFSTLQRSELRNNLHKTICKDEYSEGAFKKKRKLCNDRQNLFNSQPRKRVRCKSQDCVHEEFQRTFPYDDSTSRDDCFIQGCSLVDTVIILKNYFKCLPQNLWNTFFCSVLKAMNNLEPTNSKVEFKALELLFSRKVSSFSTKLICNDVYDKCEHLIFEKIHLCRHLKVLYIHYNVHSNFMDIFLSSLSRLSNLRCIMLLPETKQSFHMAIPIIAKHCRHLEELVVIYESELFSSEINNISCLIGNKKLRNLMLYSYGKGSETEYIMQLLYNLSDLVYFYHRELPHAIINISFKRCQADTFKLKALILATYIKGTGSQLCYLPEDSIRRIGLVCPHISHLKLVRPSNLSETAVSLPSLMKLQVHDFNVKESLITCLERKSLNCLVSLNLNNNEYIDYGCIFLIANCCPQLQELEIIHSNLFSSDDLKITKNAFPQLRKLKIQKFPLAEQTEPRFVYSHKLIIDKNLFKYLLSGTTFLEELYLEFDTETVQYRENNSNPNEEELISLISSCKELKDLMLLSCSNVTYKMLNCLVHACPNLQHLWDIDLWKIPSIEMDKIVKHYSHLFFQSYKRSTR